MRHVVFHALWVVWVACTVARAQGQQPPPTASPQNVLTIHWSSEDYPGIPIVDSSIRAVLSSSGLAVDYFAEYLESDRLPATEAANALRDYIRHKFNGRPIHLVVAISNPAMQFALANRSSLFPDAPIVFSTTTAPTDDIRLNGPGASGVVTHLRAVETLELALRLHPRTDRVLVIAQAPDGRYATEMRTLLSTFATRVKLEYLNEDSIDRLVAGVKAAPPRSLVLFLRHSQEEPGHVLYPPQVAELVAQASPVPVYGISELYLGAGVVGGIMTVHGALGTRVGTIGLRILRGERAADIELQNVPSLPILDWRQVRRWSIDTSLIPVGTEIRFRVPTVWETYRGYIVAAASLLAVQSVLIGGLLAQRRRRRRAEQVIRANEAELRTSYERIRQLARGLINAQEAARTRIARDLHDDVCQELAALSMRISQVQHRYRSLQDATLHRSLATLQQRATALVDGVRNLSHDLHPSTLQQVGLVAALESHVVEIEQSFDVQVGVTASGDCRNLPHELALCLFRIAQEALRNAATHADARRLSVSLTCVDDHIALTIADDGAGFDLEEARRSSRGLGLVSMEERAHLVRGELRVTTRPGQGTTIQVRVPHSGKDVANVPMAADVARLQGSLPQRAS
jgi:signal transduction histidine kinase